MPSADAERARGGAPAALAAVRRDMSAAWRLARERPPVLAAVLAKSPVAFAGGGAWVLINLIADRIPFAGSGAVTLGLLQCVRGIGTGVGPVIADAMVRRGTPIGRAAGIAAWTAFLGIAALSGAGHWAALLAATLAWGMGGGGNWVLSSAEVQRLSPESFVGRLSAIDNLAWTTAMCLAALGGAALVDRTGAHATSAWLGLSAGLGAWIGVRWVVGRRAAAAPAVAALDEAPSAVQGTGRVP
jgi:hypothetical protein